MIRSSKHILKYQTVKKTNSLNQLFEDYTTDLKLYIDLILSEKLPLKKFMSSKLLPNNKIFHGQWKQVIYKQASEIIRSNIRKAENKRYNNYKKVYKYFINSNRLQQFTSKRFKELNLRPIFLTKYFPETNLRNTSINIDSRLFDSLIKPSGEFNEFINLRLPYRDPFGKHRKSLTLKIPIKYHKHSLKFSSWKRLSTIKLLKINNNYYLSFSYEKDKPEIKKQGKTIGIDCGYKKLLVTSDNQIVGKNLEELYEKISRKKQGSKKFKKCLTERNKIINQEVNKLDLPDVNHIIVEDLKNVKRGSKGKINKKFNNKLQRWSYQLTLSKIERTCEENGILLTKVDPSYTSQTCSKCKVVDKTNRQGEIYKCKFCNLEIDADLNASINILHRGVYNPSTLKSQEFNFYDS